MTPPEPVRNAASSRSWDPFVVIPENQLAFTAVSLLLRRQTSLCPTLVILCGPKGSGKSHLAGHLIRANLRRKSSYRHAYLSAKDLLPPAEDEDTQDGGTSGRPNPAPAELVVCEDLHEIDGLANSQQAIRSALEVILESSARVLLTSRTPIGQLSGLSRRLINRCHGGVNVQIEQLAACSRADLVKQFARNAQIPASSAACEALASGLPASAAELMLALTELDAFARRQNCEISTDLVQVYLQKRSISTRLDTNDVVEVVARAFGVTVAQLRSRSRVEGLSLARQCAMYLARELTGETFESISRFFSGRSHTAVIHACSRFRSRLGFQPDLQQRLNEMRRTLASAP